ncbi:MAG TPA: YncE family protein [Williamwhitmania sp.]|nr:YncE family protein [Williamwhitmania sp.]
MKHFSFCLSLAALLLIGMMASAQSTYSVVNKISVEGDGGWDYLTVDQANGLLFISHFTMAQAIDLKTGKVVGTIPDTKGIHGIAIADDLNKGFTSNGRDSSVTVFDLTTFQVIETVKIPAKNPDAILYDQFSQKVFTFNGGSNTSTVIDAKTNKVLATIPLDGKPEFSATDGAGKIYVNIEDKSVINVISAVSFEVVQRWSIAPGEEPSGLALDNVTHRLFSVCSNKLMVVSDAIEGKVVATLPIGEHCDGVAFDPMLSRAYSSNGDGTITVVQEENANSFKVMEAIPTQRGARTIAVDKGSHHLYLSVAEYEAAPTEGHKRPAIKPGTFVVLDVAPVK